MPTKLYRIKKRQRCPRNFTELKSVRDANSSIPGRDKTQPSQRTIQRASLCLWQLAATRLFPPRPLFQCCHRFTKWQTELFFVDACPIQLFIEPNLLRQLDVKNICHSDSWRKKLCQLEGPLLSMWSSILQHLFQTITIVSNLTTSPRSALSFLSWPGRSKSYSPYLGQESLTRPSMSHLILPRLPLPPVSMLGLTAPTFFWLPPRTRWGALLPTLKQGERGKHLKCESSFFVPGMDPLWAKHCFFEDTVRKRSSFKCPLQGPRTDSNWWRGGDECDNVVVGSPEHWQSYFRQQ